MKKTFKLIDLDCAHCASKIEKAVKKLEGVNDAEVNFLAQKMIIDIEDDKVECVAIEAEKIVKKFEPDVTFKRV